MWQVINNDWKRWSLFKLNQVACFSIFCKLCKQKLEFNILYICVAEVFFVFIWNFLIVDASLFPGFPKAITSSCMHQVSSVKPYSFVKLIISKFALVLQCTDTTLISIHPCPMSDKLLFVSGMFAIWGQHWWGLLWLLPLFKHWLLTCDVWYTNTR